MIDLRGYWYRNLGQIIRLWAVNLPPKKFAVLVVQVLDQTR